MRTNLSKRIIALLLTLAMIFTLVPGVFAEEPAARTPFTDVTNPQSWYYDAVAYVYENGLMKGMTETTFGPDVTLERCMLVTVLHRIVKEPEATAKVNFTDIPDDAYFKNPVQWAVENEITMGTGETTFSPHDEVTREQLATFLMRFAKYQGKDVSARAEIKDFPDDQDASDWAVEPLQWAVAKGILKGVDEDGTAYLRPKESTTRAQVAAVLMRYLTEEPTPTPTPALDKTALEAAIKEAEAIDKADYTEASVKALDDAIAAAKKALDEAKTQDELDAAKKALDDAVAALEQKPAELDKTALEAAIKEAEAIDKDEYTDASVKALEDALAAAKKALDEAKTQDELDAAKKALDEAVAALEKKPAELDKTALEAAIKEAEAIDKDEYTDASVKALEDALAAAKKALDEAKTQDELDAAKKALDDAVAALEKKPKLEPRMENIDFTDPAEAVKFEVLKHNTGDIVEGDGLTLVATRPAFEPCKGQNEGDLATIPEDVIRIPVKDDWIATLTFDADLSGAQNGYYQFFGFYAAQGEDYQNLAGIRAGDKAMQNFIREDGVVTHEDEDDVVSAPGVDTNKTYYLRIEKVGTTYTCYRSENGKTFTKMFTYENTGIEADYIILDAYTGMTEGYRYTLKSLVFGVEPLDKTALEAAIKEAEAIDKGDYTEESVKALEDALAAAKKALDEAETQEELDAAKKALDDAVAALVEKPQMVDAYVLTTQLKAGDEVVVYNPARKQALANTVKDGLAAAAPAQVEDEILTFAEDAPVAVFIAEQSENGLVLRLKDGTALAIGETNEKLAYTAEPGDKGVWMVQTADEAAKTVLLRSAGVTEQIIVVIPLRYEALDAAIAEAKAVNAADYTDESVKAMTDALAAAEAIRAKEDATQEEVDAAAQALKNAILALQKKPDPTQGTYGLSKTIKAGDQVVIYNPGHGKAIKNETDNDWYLTAQEITPAGNKIESPDASLVWTVQVDEAGNYSFVSGSNAITAWPSNTYVELTNDPTHEGAVTTWSLTEADADTCQYYISSTGVTTTYGPGYIECFAKQGVDKICGYSTNKPSLNDYGFQFYVKGASGEPEEPDPQPTVSYKLATELKTGDEVVIYNPAAKKALSSEPLGNYYLSAKAATVEENAIAEPDASTVWTVTVNEDGSYSFKQGSYDLSTYVNGTHINISNTAEGHDPNWILEPVTGTDSFTMKSATVAKEDGTPVYAEYYSRYDEFTVYATSTPTGDAYAMQFYVKGASGEPEEPDPQPTVSYKLATELKTGDEVVIYNPGAKKALSSEPLGNYYLAAKDATVEENAIAEPDASTVWTVTVNEDGSYSFKQGSYDLSAYVNGTHINISNTAEGHDPNWILEPVTGTDSFTMKSATVAKEDGTPVYAEYYSRYDEFTVYATATPTGDAYAMQFYVKGASGEPEEPDPQPTVSYKLATELKTGDEVVIYNPGAKKALSSTVKGNYYLTSMDATVEENAIAEPDETTIWTVTVNEDGSYSFKQGSYDLSAYVNDTHINISNTAEGHDPNWILEPVTGTDSFTMKSATVTKADGTPVYAEYYSRYDEFTVYATSTPTGDAFAMQFYVKEQAPKGFALAETVKDGDNAVIVLASKNKAISTTGYLYEKKNQRQMLPADVTVEDGTITSDTEGLVYTVHVLEDGGVLLEADGKYLTAGDTGSELFLSDTQTTYSTWELVQAEGGWFIKSVNAKYNNNDQFVEFYTNFTTYGKNSNADLTIYTFAFYIEG